MEDRLHIVFVLVYVVFSRALHPVFTQVSNAVVRLYGPLPPALLLQCLQQLIKCSSISSSVVDSPADSKQALDTKGVAQLVLNTTQQPSETVQKQVAILVDQVVIATKVPALAISPPTSTTAVRFPAGQVTAEVARLWDLNCPHPEQFLTDAFSLEMQAAAAALLELVPASLPCMTKTVRVEINGVKLKMGC